MLYEGDHWIRRAKNSLEAPRLHAVMTLPSHCCRNRQKLSIDLTTEPYGGLPGKSHFATITRPAEIGLGAKRSVELRTAVARRVRWYSPIFSKITR